MFYDFKNSAGQIEKVSLEKWVWGVVYNDKTELHQFRNEDRSFHQFKEIEQEKVAMFVMYKHEDNTKRFDLVCKDKVQYFHFYRNVVLNANSKEETKKRIYVFGWKTGKKSAYHYIMPDDRIIIADHDIADITQFNP